MQPYLLLALAVLLMALDNILRKRFQITAGTSLQAGLRFNMLLGGSAAALFWAAGGFQFTATPFSLILALIQAALAVAYTVVGFRIMRRSVALYALFHTTGGMLVPSLAGMLFLNEACTAPKLLGMALILAAVIISRTGSLQAERSLLPSCIGVFVLNGLASAVTKLHQVPFGHPAVASMDFVVLVNLGKLLVSALTLGLTGCRRNAEPASAPHRLSLLPVLACTAVSGTAYLLQLTAAKSAGASVMYPLITAGTIIASALLAWLFYRESPSRRSGLCMLLCLLGSCFFL